MNYFRKILNLVIALIGLNFVVLIHEFGHFIFCKAFDVRTPTFSVGFDPAIAAHKFRGTKYQIGAIPLGGYVSINEQDLANRAYPKKMAIIFAGILFNFIFGFLVLYYLYSKKQKHLELAKKDESDDYFDSGKENYLDQEHRYEDMDHLKRELQMERPQMAKRSKLVDFISKATPDEARVLLQSHSKNRFMGPIGIISAISQSITLGFDTFIYFLATVSLNIGFFNLFPLSFLDGGQALYYTTQALFGKKFISSGFGNLSYIMFALALLFLLFVSFKDILNLRRSK